jgi:hypothetical protein
MTEADFTTTVAENLGILGTGQSLSNEDAAIIRRRMTSVLARLAKRELTTVANTNDIPEAEALALADIVAYECATPFSIAGQKLAELAAKGSEDPEGSAVRALRMVRSERPHKSTLTQGQWWGEPRSGYYNGTE